MTRHDPQLLWRTYESLPTLQKAAIGIRALIGDPIEKSTFVQALAASRVRSPEGKPWTAQRAGGAAKLVRPLSDRSGRRSRSFPPPEACDLRQ
jgi:hypothetical protein